MTARLALATVLALVALAAPATLAQPATWEAMPPVRYFPDMHAGQIGALDFLYGEGPLASDPTADTLVVFVGGADGVFLYNPSGAAGAAGPNISHTGDDWGAWHPLCPAGTPCLRSYLGMVTAAGSVVSGGFSRAGRSTDRGRTWTFDADVYPDPFFESTLPSVVGPDGTPALFGGVGDGGETARSLADGAPGTWEAAGLGLGYPLRFGEVPPSPALPQGRLLLGVEGGVRRSDDGGLSYVVAALPGPATYFAYSFAFAPAAGHPYGGVAYAGVHNRAFGDGAGAEVLRSGDGGTTWALAHRFTAAQMELSVPAGTDVTEVELLATPDGALWAGVAQGTGSSYPPRGGVMRSVDGGQTWARADAGFRNAQGWGYAVSQLAVSRMGVLYAATFRGVWRTTAPVVAGESSPGEVPEVGVSVRPNPVVGRVEVVVSLAEAQAVRVVVLDALGREVAVVLDGETAAGERSVGVDTQGWPAGVYVVRATAGARVASARLVVVR